MPCLSYVILYGQVSNVLRQKKKKILNLPKNCSRITFITGDKNYIQSSSCDIVGRNYRNLLEMRQLEIFVTN